MSSTGGSTGPRPTAVADLADARGLQTLTFRRAFRTATGQLPHRYLTTVRVEMAARFLRTSRMPISRIALDVGFATLSSFNRSFRTLTGVTPGQWRAGARRAGDRKAARPRRS
ncbi:MAG: helix-turn-helix domain-containing protein [Chitinivibrionales bacterium]|nr:helix-turn-helix domain-containing protein [Chitinivibrionales bacterium]